MKRTVDQSVLDARNKVMIEAINSGQSSVRMAHVYGISRERVAQLYFKLTGKSLRQLKMEKFMEIERRRIEELGNRKCIRCGKSIIHSKRRKFCGSYCRNKTYSIRRDQGKKVKCFGCGVVFSPYYTTKYSKRTVHHFHNQKCYLENLHRVTRNSPYRKMIAERTKSVKELLNKGWSAKKISVFLGVSINTVYTWINKAKEL